MQKPRIEHLHVSRGCDVESEEKEKTIALTIRSIDPSLSARLIALPNLQEMNGQRNGGREGFWRDERVRR